MSASFFDFSAPSLDGAADIVGQQRGKVTVVVNVASFCGYTRQYAGLQGIHQELKDKQFTVLGFPCNQFGAQEPGTAAEIQSFCSLNYAVSFPLAAKIEVNGPRRHPVYAWLTAAENGFPGDIAWNFEKFLITRDGRLACRYPAALEPTNAGFLQDIADCLD